MCVHRRPFNITHHVQKFETTLTKLKVNGPKRNIEKSFLGQTKI